MKIPLTYGFIMAIGGAILTLLLYFTGMHDSAEKMSSAQWIGGVGGLAITVTCLALAMRERRATSASTDTWTYGSAFGAGVLTGLCGVVFGAVFTYIYFAYINPNMSDVILQMQTAKLEAKGMSASRIADAEPMMRKMMAPAVVTLFQGLSGCIGAVVLALIVAIFFRKRSASETGAMPPPVG